jgi:hypothetical protein
VGAPVVAVIVFYNLSAAHINVNREHFDGFAFPEYVYHPVSRSRARYNFDDRADGNRYRPAPALNHRDSKGGAFKFELLASQHDVDFAKEWFSRKLGHSLV